MAKKRIFAFDFLKAVAIVAVVANHTLTKFAHTSFELHLADYLNNVLRFAVPVFLFVSGALYRVNGDFSYLKQKLWRIIKIYLYYFVPTTLLIWWQEGAMLSNLQFDWFGLIFGRGFGHFFVFVIVTVTTLVYALLQFEFFRKHLDRLFIYSLLASLFWLSIDEAIYQGYGWYHKYIQGVRQNDFLFYRNPLTWISFFTFGIWYQQASVKTWLKKYQLQVTIGSLASIVVITFMYLAGVGDYVPYGSVAWLLFSFGALFLLLYDATWFKTNPWITSLSEGSYHIFLSHFLLVFILEELEKRGSISIEFTQVPVVFILVLLSAWGWSILLPRITAKVTQLRA